MAQMKQTFADMYQDAGKQGAASVQAMNTVANAAEEINRRLTAVRQGAQEAVGRGVETVNAAVEKLHTRLGEVETTINKAHQTVTESVGKMAESYKGLSALIQASLDAQTTAIVRHAEAQKTTLEQSTVSQAAAMAKTTEILTSSLNTQTQLRQQATSQMEIKSQFLGGFQRFG
jgi:phage-related minor tail protein